MTIQELDALLDLRPVEAAVHPASLLFLSSLPRVDILSAALLDELDSPLSMSPERRLVLQAAPQVLAGPSASASTYGTRLRRVVVEHDPFVPELNRLLPHGYAWLRERMLCQSQLASRIVQTASALDSGSDRVVTLWLDGLSFVDARDFPSCEPCLVDGLSITPSGFERLVGSPPLASRLFDLGFRKRAGFSYWRRESNELSNRIFSGIADVRRSRGFGDVLQVLEDGEWRGSYIQIVRDGLDHLSHGHQREVPNVEAVVAGLHAHLLRLMEVLAAKPGRSLLFVASDHGLLWKHRAALQVLASGPRADAPRYYNWNPHNGHTTEVDEADSSIHALHFPFVRRALASDEAGCHGGLSLEESIIPFCSIEIG